MKKKSLKFFGIIFSFLFLSNFTPAARPLLHYGYYHAQTSEFGYFMEELAEYTNLLILNPAGFENEDDLFDETLGLPQAFELGYQVILDLSSYSVQENTVDFSRLEGKLKALKKQIDISNPPYRKALFGIFLFDEPSNHGVSFEAEVWALTLTGEFFPGIPKIINYSMNELLYGLKRIPEGLDIVSFDAYYFTDENSKLKSKLTLDQYLGQGIQRIRILAPGKPVLFIAQSFSSPQSGHRIPQLRELEQQVLFAEQTPEVMGLIWFMMGSLQSETNKILGAKEYPLVLKKQKGMGLRLKEDW